MELEAATIPFFVVGQHFGSLYPGMQMPSYNERSVRVHASYLHEALEAIQHVRSYYSPTFANLDTKSKFRIHGAVSRISLRFIQATFFYKAIDREFRETLCTLLGE